MARNNPRLSGLISLIVGAFLAWLCIWSPYQAAANHADTLSLNFKGVMLAVFGLLYGPAMLILPAPLVQQAGASARSPLQTLAMILALGASIGFYFWFKGVLSGMGYNFNGAI